MNEGVKISLCMSVYNGGRFLGEQLESIARQTRVPDEVVIVDDCSNDKTAGVVASYKDRLPIRYYLNETNLGFKKGFRKAIGLSKGDLVFLCDQDDVWADTKIEEMAKIMTSNHEIHLLCCNYECLLQEGAAAMILPGSERNDGKVLPLKKSLNLLDGYRPGCCFCFDRHLKEQYLQIDDDEVYHDFALWLLALVEDAAYVCHRQLIKWRRHAANASTHSLAEDPKRSAALLIARVAKENLHIYKEVLPHSKPVWSKRVRKADKLTKTTYAIFQKFTCRKAFSILMSNFAFYRLKVTLNTCRFAYRFRKEPIF